jgi:hypothetical protein
MLARHLTPLFTLLFATVAVSAKEALTREIPWDGCETLIVDVPADVQFIQAPGAGKIVVTGPRRSVETFEVAGGVLKDRTLRTGAQLKIVVTAPKITRFSIKGDDTLTIEGFDQDKLHIDATGRADVKASGRVGTVTLNLQGFGWADLSQLDAQGAEVALTGSRKTLIAPSSWAKLSGRGAVVLLTPPETLTLDFSGAGRVLHAYRGETARGLKVAALAPHTQP